MGLLDGNNLPAVRNDNGEIDDDDGDGGGNDDDADDGGEDDDDDDDDDGRRTPPLERPWRVQRWSNHSQSGVQCQPLFSLDIVAIILRIIVITVVIKFIKFIDSHHYHYQQYCNLYLQHHQITNINHRMSQKSDFQNANTVY